MRKSRRTAVRMIVMLLVVALIFGGVFGWGALRAYFIAKFLAGFGHQVQTVAAIKAETSPWQPHLQSVGTVTAVNGADLSAEIAGIVDTIDFQSGTDVRKGTVLLTLRPNNDPAVLAQLEATASLDQITYDRDQKQYHADAIAKAQLDTDRANLASAQAQVAAQKALMAEKIVRAPFSGRLGIREVNVGQYLPVGTSIVTLQQLDPLYVDFYLPQQALAQLAVGQKLDVTIDAFPGKNFPGTITAINAAVDSATRNIQVRATLPNPDLILRPGMFGSIALDVGAPRQLITLPQTAITYNPYGDTVYVLKKGKDAQGQEALIAHSEFVQLGDTRGDQVAILSGIDPGDEIVTAGQIKLRNGAVVAVNNDVQPPNNPNPNPPNE